MANAVEMGEATCAVCGKTFKRLLVDIMKTEKKGRKLYCSRTCFQNRKSNDYNHERNPPRALTRICQAFTRYGNPCENMSRAEYDGLWFCGLHAPSQPGRRTPVLTRDEKIIVNVSITAEQASRLRRAYPNTALRESIRQVIEGWNGETI